MNEKWLLMGSSRGLGWATYKELNLTKSLDEFLLISRKIEPSKEYQCYQSDFSKLPIQDQLLQKISDFDPTYIIYFAGGGPYGNFETKKISDHEWAMNVNFNFPMHLIHHLKNNKTLQQIIFMGSQIAEDKPDIKAASYCAGKHALKGLVSTVQKEDSLPFKLRLFSPGYMKTDLLPLNSQPRLNGQAEEAEIVAKRLVNFIKNDNLFGY